MNDTKSMALYCDFENVALGVRESRYKQFDISRVLERLLLKGSIVVKKAYCDWERYREFKNAMHQASFELIEIPHVRMSGKNSADIRMVVDALDLCYTKSHVDTFVIISGDSDFSPLVSKLRENNKTVIGVGVKNSTSDLLIANCDEFIYYDDLVRDERPAARAPRRRPPARPAASSGRAGASAGVASAGQGGAPSGASAGQAAAGRLAVPAGEVSEAEGAVRVVAISDAMSRGAARMGASVDAGAGPGADSGAEGGGDHAASGSRAAAGSDAAGAVAGGGAPVDSASDESAPAPAAPVRRRRTRASKAAADADAARAQADAGAPVDAGVAAQAATPLDAATGVAFLAPSAGSADADAAESAAVESAGEKAAAKPARKTGTRRRGTKKTAEADSGVPADEPAVVPSPVEPAVALSEFEPVGEGSMFAEPEPQAPAAPASARALPPADDSDDAAQRRIEHAIELVVGTLEALETERGEDEKIWGSMVKQTLKRRKPGFNESYYGFRSFNRLLEEARDRGLIELELDDKSGGYTVRSLG